MASAAQQTAPAWVWCAAHGKSIDDSANFVHPAVIARGDESWNKARWEDGLRGPRLARISPIKLLRTSGDMAFIAEKGATREVPKSLVLPWYEGLLLLAELVRTQGQKGHLQADWCDSELISLLEEEKQKYKGVVNGQLWVDRKLMHTAVTGLNFKHHESGKEYSFRRENIQLDSKLKLEPGEDKDDMYRIKEVGTYVPPWEAFCDEKMGFYQDFYLIHWQFPFSEVEYSQVENGGVSQNGTTWEPDECLPSFLDNNRIKAKTAWVKAQKEQELEQRRATPPQPVEIKRKHEVAEEQNGEPRPPAKRARLKRDGSALDRDLFRMPVGHDFAPDGDLLANIRKGWPMHPQDYPNGYGVANPPGFCFENCDCMDDQRPQRSWETTKKWLEDKFPLRNGEAVQGIDNLSAQSTFVRRRGQVSKICYFETAQHHRGDETCARAASELAAQIRVALHEACKRIHLQSLLRGGEPVVLPLAAFLRIDQDYCPLHCEASRLPNGALPGWLQLDQTSGRLSATQPERPLTEDLQLLIDIHFYEGSVCRIPITITPEHALPGKANTWARHLVEVMRRFNDVARCPLLAGVRRIIGNHLSEVFDFRQQVPKNVELGEWLHVMSRCMRMLRAAAVANLVPHQSVVRQRSQAAMVQPTTPT